MQVKTQLSHSSNQEWWKDYDAGNYSGEGFLYLQIGLNSLTDAPECSQCRLKHSSLTVPVRNQIAKCICSNFKKYLSKLQNVFVQISKCICQIAKCICSNFKKYLSELQNVFVQISECIAHWGFYPPMTLQSFIWLNIAHCYCCFIYTLPLLIKRWTPI